MTHSDGLANRASHGSMRATIGVAIVGLLVVLGVFPAIAQDDIESLEDLKEEREEILEAAAETAELIDVETANVDELSAALDEMNGIVMLQEARLEDARRDVDLAQSAVDAATERREEVARERADIRKQIAEMALASFTGETAVAGDDITELALSEDPGAAARLRHLVQLQTGSLSDNLDRMRALDVEAQQLIAEQETAVQAVEASLELVRERTAALESARDRQAVLVIAAETQLEARLAEAAFIEERDHQLATEIRDQQQSINQRIAVTARNQGVEIPPPVNLDDIVLVTFEEFDSEFVIEVHVDIEAETKALFTEAFEAGLDLGGWGYRPIQLQIELRAAHCGGTDYDIWHKPVFECAPPTARPGFSKHEQGRAIDFTIGGSSIRDVNSAAFRWLASHAPSYGFVNLPEEPWHWSIDH